MSELPFALTLAPRTLRDTHPFHTPSMTEQIGAIHVMDGPYDSGE